MPDVTLAEFSEHEHQTYPTREQEGSQKYKESTVSVNNAKYIVTFHKDDETFTWKLSGI